MFAMSGGFESCPYSFLARQRLETDIKLFDNRHQFLGYQYANRSMPHDTYHNFDSTVVYPFLYAMTQRILVGLNPLEDRDEVLQVFFDRCNLVWSIFNGFPKPVKLDAGFCKLESNGNNSKP